LVFIPVKKDSHSAPQVLDAKVENGKEPEEEDDLDQLFKSITLIIIIRIIMYKDTH
jgi:hypothetical protein